MDEKIEKKLSNVSYKIRKVKEYMITQDLSVGDLVIVDGKYAYVTKFKPQTVTADNLFSTCKVQYIPLTESESSIVRDYPTEFAEMVANSNYENIKKI